MKCPECSIDNTVEEWDKHTEEYGYLEISIENHLNQLSTWVCPNCYSHIWSEEL